MRHQIIKHTPVWIKKAIVELIRSVELIKYRGNKVYCVVCNTHFSSFAPDRHHVRKTARCPNCDSLERHRLYWKYLIDNVLLTRSAEKIKVLHIAPERSFYNNLSKMENIDYYPGDLNPGNFSLKMNRIDLTKLPYTDNFFDVILCNHVLEHIPNDKKAMKEMKRVLKDGGIGFIQVPLDKTRNITYEDPTIVTRKNRKKVFGHETHVRIYGKDFIQRMEKVGFNVVIVDYLETFTEEQITYYGFSKSQIFISS